MSKTKPLIDLSQRFLFEKKHIRGELIRIQQTLKDLLKYHDYNAIEKRLLAQVICVACMMSSMLKVKGKFSIQLQSPSNLKLLLVQVSNQEQLRALLQSDSPLETDDLLAIARGGHLLVSLYAETMRDPYQTIIPIHHHDLVGCIEHYFEQSEQLKTRLWLKDDGETFAGFLLQALPEMDEEAFWEEAVMFCETVEDQELLNLPFEELVYRLFHEQNDVRLFDATPLSFHCGCSREKMHNAIAVMPPDEVQEILAEDGQMSLRCDFCHQYYTFTAEDLAEDVGGGGQAQQKLH